MTASVLQARMTPFRILPEEGLFSAVVMRVFAIVNDGVQKRAQDSHSAFNKEKRFKPEVGAVAENADGRRVIGFELSDLGLADSAEFLQSQRKAVG
jgi:hypothetical protein